MPLYWGNWNQGGPIVAVTIGSSPFTYTAPRNGTLQMSGVNVSGDTLTYSRDGVTFFPVGPVNGGRINSQFTVPMFAGDQVVYTYTSTSPLMHFIPGKP